MTVIYAVIWIVTVVLLYGMVNRGRVLQNDLALLEKFVNAADNQPETDNAEQASS